jgi:hypothetical protein
VDFLFFSPSDEDLLAIFADVLRENALFFFIVLLAIRRHCNSRINLIDFKVDNTFFGHFGRVVNGTLLELEKW